MEQNILNLLQTTESTADLKLKNANDAVLCKTNYPLKNQKVSVKKMKNKTDHRPEPLAQEEITTLIDQSFEEKE